MSDDQEVAREVARADADETLTADERTFFRSIAETCGLSQTFRPESAAERLGLDVADVEAMCLKLVSRHYFSAYGYVDEVNVPPERRAKLYGLSE